MFKINYVFSEECTVLCFNHIKLKQHLKDYLWQYTVFWDNNESIKERSAILVIVHPLKHSNCPLNLLLKSDWGNHAETTDVARRITLQYHHEVCSSNLIGATMPRQQTWRGGSLSSIIMRSVPHIWLGQPCWDNRRGEEYHSTVSSWGLLLTSDWGNHAKTTNVARRITWQQQSSRLDDKSISRRLSALITYYSNQKHRTSSF
jgi:hypothetical protein